MRAFSGGSVNRCRLFEQVGDFVTGIGRHFHDFSQYSAWQ